MKEHQTDAIKKKPVSKVCIHTSDTGRGFDFDNVKVLDFCSNLRIQGQLEIVQSNSISRGLWN